MSVWFFINLFLLVTVIIRYLSGSMMPHLSFGTIAFLFIVYNWTRQAVFSSIRSQKLGRQWKISLAKLSKKMLRFHKWTGSLALLFALSHILAVLYYFPLQMGQGKWLTGGLTFIFLSMTVLFGWLRFLRTTVARRYIHWTLAYCLIFSAVLHLFFK